MNRCLRVVFLRALFRCVGKRRVWRLPDRVGQAYRRRAFANDQELGRDLCDVLCE